MKGLCSVDDPSISLCRGRGLAGPVRRRRNPQASTVPHARVRRLGPDRARCRDAVRLRRAAHGRAGDRVADRGHPLAGLLFHVSLDTVHITLMSALKRSLSKQAHYVCPGCGKPHDALQLHTVHFARNLLDRYSPRHFVVLCPTCHERAHGRGETNMPINASYVSTVDA